MNSACCSVSCMRVSVSDGCVFGGRTPTCSGAAECYHRGGAASCAPGLGLGILGVALKACLLSHPKCSHRPGRTERERPGSGQIQAPGRGQAKPAPGGVVPDLGPVRVIVGQAEPPGAAGASQVGEDPGAGPKEDGAASNQNAQRRGRPGAGDAGAENYAARLRCIST